MSRRANPTLIGAFVVGAITLVALGLIAFGSGRFFEERGTYVAYFEGSMAGLSAGAPVLFRGVRVGSVSDIRITIDLTDLSMRVPVLLELMANSVKELSGEEPIEGTLPKLIERGLRAQLQTQSLLTGQLQVELDFHPEKPAEFHDEGLTGFPEMPTIPSTLQELAERLQKLSLDELVNSAEHALRAVSRLLESDEVTDAIREFDRAMQAATGALESVETLSEKVNAEVDPVSTTLRRALRQADETLRQADATLREAEDALSIAGEGSPVRHELTRTLQELSSAARSIRVLAEYIERHPEALLTGKNPPGGSR